MADFTIFKVMSQQPSFADFSCRSCEYFQGSNIRAKCSEQRTIHARYCELEPVTRFFRQYCLESGEHLEVRYNCV